MASCPPACCPSSGWKLGSLCIWLPVGSCTTWAVGMNGWADTKYVHMQAVERVKGVECARRRRQSEAGSATTPAPRLARFLALAKVEKRGMSPRCNPTNCSSLSFPFSCTTHSRRARVPGRCGWQIASPSRLGSLWLVVVALVRDDRSDKRRRQMIRKPASTREEARKCIAGRNTPF